jgi:outer membrane protein, adhesin transport system
MLAPSRLKIIVSLIALGFAGAPAYSQTLKDAVEQSLKSNPDILVDANHRLSTDEAVKVARGGYYPKVDLALGAGREWSDNPSTRTPPPQNGLTLSRGEASLTLRQMLFDGFAVQSEVERNQARVESAAYKVAGTSEQVALRAIEAYLEVLRNRELVTLTKENLGIHERTNDQIKIRSDSGLGRKADSEQIRSRFALSKSNVASAEANLRDAEINFMRIVGMKPGNLDKQQELDRATLPKSLDEAVQMAFDRHPILKSANADVEATGAQYRAAKSANSPRVDLELGMSKNRSLDGVEGANDDKYAMVRLHYTLFNGGSDTARARETAHLMNEAREVMSRTQRQVEQSTRLSWNAMDSVQERLPSLKEYAEFSAATRDAYNKQFSIGQRTLLDMLDAENEAYTASTNYVNGKYLSVFARYRLLADMGQLLNTLGISQRPEAQISAKK